MCTSPSYGHSHRERGMSCDPLVTMVTTGMGPCRREDLDPALIVFAGGTAGMSFWLAAIVPDTLKSILQTGTRQKHGGVHVVCYPCSYISPLHPTAPEGKYRSAADVYRDLVCQPLSCAHIPITLPSPSSHAPITLPSSSSHDHSIPDETRGTQGTFQRDWSHSAKVISIKCCKSLLQT